jgi:F0F1-type ATP synthase membrane subunit b/b'
MKKIRSRAEADALREKEQIAELANQEAEKVKRYAELEVAGQVKAGTRELREYAAELATRLAEERIKKKLNAEAHSRLIDKSIERIKALYEKPGTDQKIHARPS